jgi:ABC-type cobalamin/Fe3+-siderophores transport system ATPase subunit
MLRLDGLRAGYGRTAVLHGISLCLEDGEMVAVLGRNGAGKSTLLKAVIGELPLIDGKVILDGRDIGRFGTFLALTRLIVHGRSLGEGLVPLGLDVGEVHEEILRAVLRGDEAVTLGFVEPLDATGCHVKHLPTLFRNELREAVPTTHTFENTLTRTA